MAKEPKLEIGKTYYPKEQKMESSEECVRGAWWRVEKLLDGYVFEFLAARHGGGVDKYAISQAEFEKVKDGEWSVDDLLAITDRNSNRRPIT